jgi:hypothetical protein
MIWWNGAPFHHIVCWPPKRICGPTRRYDGMTSYSTATFFTPCSVKVPAHSEHARPYCVRLPSPLRSVGFSLNSCCLEKCISLHAWWCKVIYASEYVLVLTNWLQVRSTCRKCPGPSFWVGEQKQISHARFVRNMFVKSARKVCHVLLVDTFQFSEFPTRTHLHILKLVLVPNRLDITSVVRHVAFPFSWAPSSLRHYPTWYDGMGHHSSISFVGPQKRFGGLRDDMMEWSLTPSYHCRHHILWRCYVMSRLLSHIG